MLKGPFMQHFTDDFGTIDATDARHGIKNGICLNGNFGAQLAQFVSHLSGPHVRAHGRERYFSFRDFVQFLRELGTGLAPAANDLAEIDPLCSGRLCDRLTFV